MGRLDKQRLEEIRARMNAATPGNWIAGWSGDPDWQSLDDAGPINVVAAPSLGGVATCYPTGGHVKTWDQAMANAKFIANARADVADLLDEVERLTERVSVMSEFLDPEFVADHCLSKAINGQ